MSAISKKQNSEFAVKEADEVEILSLVDNSVDFQSHINKQQVQSFRQWKQEREGKRFNKLHLNLPFAEHGFSLFIRVFSGDTSSCVLFDTGGSPMAIIKNAVRMGLDLSEIECIVLSHGHYDHFGGLVAAVKAIGKFTLPEAFVWNSVGNLYRF